PRRRASDVSSPAGSRRRRRAHRHTGAGSGCRDRGTTSRRRSSRPGDRARRAARGGGGRGRAAAAGGSASSRIGGGTDFDGVFDGGEGGFQFGGETVVDLAREREGRPEVGLSFGTVDERFDLARLVVLLRGRGIPDLAEGGKQRVFIEFGRQIHPFAEPVGGKALRRRAPDD